MIYSVPTPAVLSGSLLTNLRSDFLADKANHDSGKVVGIYLGGPIDVYPINYKNVLPARLAKRVKGNVDPSVERLNCPVSDIWIYKYPPPRAPKAKVEFRILDYTIANE